MFDFLIGRKHSRKDRQVKVSFRELKAQIYWPTTDQKVWGSNPYGRTNWFERKTELLALQSEYESVSPSFRGGLRKCWLMNV